MKVYRISRRDTGVYCRNRVGKTFWEKAEYAKNAIRMIIGEMTLLKYPERINLYEIVEFELVEVIR